MSNYDLEEDKLLKYQIVLSFIFVFTLFVSITLSYNSMNNGKKLYSDDDALIILRINRIIALFVALGFLLINMYDREIKRQFGLKNEKIADLQIISSLITLISSLIVLYIAFISSNEIIQNENPEI